MSRLKVLALGTLALAVSGIGAVVLYARYEYTLVADLREALTSTPDDRLAHGALLFRTRGCVGCHRLDDAGSEARIGPDLSGIGGRTSADDLRTSIVAPSVVIATCPDGPCRFQMPEFGSILSEDQVDALVTYLAAQ